MSCSSLTTHVLSQLADIQPGYPFRGKLPLSDEGDAFVVQFRHVVPGERLDDPHGDVLDRATLPGRRRPAYLQPGDIIFMAKGVRHDAALIGNVPPNTVCTPNFYHIRLKPGVDAITPAFLAWQLNHRDAQRYFAMCSQGSVAPSIRKAQLINVPISLPPVEQQNVMVELAEAAAQEQRLLTQLIDNRQRMLDAAGQQLLHSDITTET
jgi:hypothetical protein